MMLAEGSENCRAMTLKYLMWSNAESAPGHVIRWFSRGATVSVESTCRFGMFFSIERYIEYPSETRTSEAPVASRRYILIVRPTSSSTSDSDEFANL